MSDQPIVVGYDGSPISREALDFALATAKPSKTPIEIVQAWTASKPSAKDATDGSPAAETVLAEAIEYAKGAAPEIDVTGQLVPGDAVDALLQAAEHASIVVLGSRGLGGFSGLLVGSTGVKVATQATCPVVVVRPREADATVGPEAGRIVVGVDGSATSQTAVSFAFEQAKLQGVGLTALLSLDIPYAGPPGPNRLTPQDVLMADEDTGTELLDHALTSWREKYPDVDIRSEVVPKNAAKALIEASPGALLVVVGSRGVGGIRSLLLGSVSHAVMHHVQGPIAIVHPVAAPAE